MMIGYDVYDRFTMEHFPLRQRVTLTTKIYCSRLYIHIHIFWSPTNANFQLACLLWINSRFGGQYATGNADPNFHEICGR
jgi:hypothetical protein